MKMPVAKVQMQVRIVAKHGCDPNGVDGCQCPYAVMRFFLGLPVLTAPAARLTPPPHSLPYTNIFIEYWSLPPLVYTSLSLPLSSCNSFRLHLGLLLLKLQFPTDPMSTMVCVRNIFLEILAVRLTQPSGRQGPAKKSGNMFLTSLLDYLLPLPLQHGHCMVTTLQLV